MKGKDFNQLELSVNIFYCIDDDTDEIVFDIESIQDEFYKKLNKLVN